MGLLVDTSVRSLALRRNTPPDSPPVRYLSGALEDGTDVFGTGIVLQDMANLVDLELADR